MDSSSRGPQEEVVECAPLEALDLTEKGVTGTICNKQHFAFLTSQVHDFLSCYETAVNREMVMGKVRGDERWLCSMHSFHLSQDYLC